jgi:hypothetical protein
VGRLSGRWLRQQRRVFFPGAKAACLSTPGKGSSGRKILQAKREAADNGRVLLGFLWRRGCSSRPFYLDVQGRPASDGRGGGALCAVAASLPFIL